VRQEAGSIDELEAGRVSRPPGSVGKPIYASAAVIGIGAAIILPSLQAVVPALVEPGDLDRAVTLNSLTFNIARG